VSATESSLAKVSSPLLCTPEQKPHLEARNGVDQIGYIDYLVNKLQAVELRDSHVQEFHAIAVNEIYPCAAASTAMR
jgi:hypothetical protein